MKIPKLITKIATCLGFLGCMLSFASCQNNNYQAPYIGEDGYWYVNGERTDYKAEGEDGAPGTPGSPGEPGITPHIGENGHWWIGEVDTGVSAQGAQGEPGDPGDPGLTPYIGENGHWWIGETDTGVNAQGPQGEPGGTTPVDDHLVDLVMFMGQSNMAGRGVAEEATVVGEGHGYEFKAISDPTKLYPAVEPFGKQENNPSSGISESTKTGGMTTSFIEAYYSQTKVPIVGVSCSKGGTDMSYWTPDGAFIADALNRHATARTWLENNGYEIRHDFMVWCQGESDAGKLKKDEYMLAFEAMLNKMMDNGIEKACIIRIGNHGNSASAHDEIIAAQTEYPRRTGKAMLATAKLAELSKTPAIASEYMKDSLHFKQSTYNIAGSDAGKNVGKYFSTGIEPNMYDGEYDKYYYPHLETVISLEDLHNFSNEYSHDELSHWRECLDPGCSVIGNLGPHDYVVTGLGTATNDTGGTITYTCSTCGYSVTEEYVRSGSGITPYGSGNYNGQYLSDLGAFSYYNVALKKEGFVNVDGRMAVVFSLSQGGQGSGDGTLTGAGFRNMTTFTQATNVEHTYEYIFKNMGEKTLNFQVYQRASGSDKSNPTYYDVSLEPGEIKHVNVNYVPTNANPILSYFKFNDETYIGNSLAIALTYHAEAVIPSASTTVNLTGATFEGGLSSKDFIPGSHLEGIEDSSIIGVKDTSNNRCYSLEEYVVPNVDNVSLNALTDNSAALGDCKIDFWSTNDAMVIDNYAVNAGKASPYSTYIGEERAAVIQFTGTASGADNTGTNASFRFRYKYNSGSGKQTKKMIWTFKNIGNKTLAFDVYQRSSGTDTSAVTAYPVAITAGETASVEVVLNRSISTNGLTYIRFDDDNYLGQKMAVYCYAELV